MEQSWAFLEPSPRDTILTPNKMAPQTPTQRAANEKYARRELAKKGKRVAPTYKSKLNKKQSRKIPTGYIGKFEPFSLVLS